MKPRYELLRDVDLDRPPAPSALPSWSWPRIVTLVVLVVLLEVVIVVGLVIASGEPGV